MVGSIQCWESLPAFEGTHVLSTPSKVRINERHWPSENMGSNGGWHPAQTGHHLRLQGRPLDVPPANNPQPSAQMPQRFVLAQLALHCCSEINSCPHSASCGKLAPPADVSSKSVRCYGLVLQGRQWAVCRRCRRSSMNSSCMRCSRPGCQGACVRLWRLDDR